MMAEVTKVLHSSPASACQGSRKPQVTYRFYERKNENVLTACKAVTSWTMADSKCVLNGLHSYQIFLQATMTMLITIV